MGFLNPRNLAWGVSLALLVLIYLRSRSRPTIEVSSLMLFDEAPAPVARVRLLRIDLLFWLEMATLAALTLAIAGLYLRLPTSPGHGRSHALVFDLGAGMSAHEESGTRLDAAKRQALAVISAAPIGDEFSVIGYALEAQLRHPQSANLDSVRVAIASLHPMAVPARAAALGAALMRAQGASEIDVFADRPLPEGALDDAGASARVNFHEVGTPAENLAIVSLEPGVTGVSNGRVAVRNFSNHPHLCELAIDLDDVEVLHQSLMLAPREQMMVLFGPLKDNGTLRARILTPDAIDADNTRYAWAASDSSAHVLVLSPDPAVRDDLARILIAINGNFQIETADPARYRPESDTGLLAGVAHPFALAVIHDGVAPKVAAESTLLVYPPLPPAQLAHGSAQAPPATTGFSVEASLPTAEMRDSSADSAAGSDALTLGPTRVVALADWMEPIATARGGERGPFAAAAIGRGAAGLTAVIAFDVRNHFLLDPDHLDALVAAVDVIKRLVVPSDLQIVTTGSYVSVPVTGSAKVTEPGGEVRTVKADASGRVRVRALQAGRYTIEAPGEKVEVLANYYDAAESDLIAPPSVASNQGRVALRAATDAPIARQVRPLGILLIALALAAMVIESALLLRHASRWGMRHV